MANEPKETDGFRLSMDKFLSEDAIRRNLILSALYLFAFEALKVAVVGDVKAFLVSDESDADEVKEYETRLHRLHQNRWRASCLFLAEIGVLSTQDMSDLQEITSHRNSIAHELPRLLVSADLDVDISLLGHIREILGKVDSWHTEYDLLVLNPELRVEDVQSGRMIVVDRVLWDVVKMLEADAGMNQDSDQPVAELADGHGESPLSN